MSFILAGSRVSYFWRIWNALQKIFVSSICILPSLRDFCTLPLLQDCYFYYILTVQERFKDHAIWLYLQSPIQPCPPKSIPFTCNISLLCLSSPFPFTMAPASPHLSWTIVLSLWMGKVKIQLAHTSGTAQGQGGSQLFPSFPPGVWFLAFMCFPWLLMLAPYVHCVVKEQKK